MENGQVRSENVEFLTIAEFKNRISKAEAKAQIVKNPNTGKLFMSIEELNFKVQATIDQSKPMSVLIPDGDLEQACLVNVVPSAENVLFTL